MSSSARRWAAALALAALTAPAAALAAPAVAPAGAAVAPGSAPQELGHRTAPWPEPVVELAGGLPIQDGGRVKPLSTFADFTLLRLCGRRSTTARDGTRLSSMEWLLDALFFPEDALAAPIFLVQNAEVIEAIGLSHADKRARDRYSYDELRAGVTRLLSLAHDYAAIEPAERSSVQEQVVLLGENVLAFERLVHQESLAIFPPVDPAERAWRAPADSTKGAARELAPGSGGPHLALETWAVLPRWRADPAAFERELGKVSESIVAAARARGEYGGIELERSYYALRPLSWSLSLFALAFVSAALLWLRPKSRWIYRASSVAALGAAALLVTAIVLRCMIRGRPPVSTLYETVLFVTAVGVLIALVLEWLHRDRLAISAAAFLGLIGLFVANGYETLDARDTMPSLVAVLDTNFWLATHVTAITMGYSAGMLAALLASAYLLGKVIRRTSGATERDPAATERDHRLARSVYGVLCFGVIFSTVGTILGGIWANESWGRFWGWDPKENGALLIVLSQLAILHGRMGGYLRDHGLCMAAAFGGTIVAFSWWGVNLLGVGLHSYGFTSGVHGALWTYYWTQWGVVALGGFSRWRERAASRARTGPASVGPVGDLGSPGRAAA